MKKKVRLFVSVDMPESVITEIERIRRVLIKKELFAATWVNPRDVHCTLAFLGDVDGRQIPLITDALASIAMSRMEARLSTLDYFATRHGRITILYLAFICDPLRALIDTITGALQPWLLERDREWHHHLTLARIKRLVDRAQLIDMIELFSVTPIIFEIAAFSLKASELTQMGPIYHTIRLYEAS